MNDSPAEIILKLGCEGGGTELLGARVAGGSWRFWLKGSSIFLDEDDNEDWRAWETAPVTTWDEALALLPADWPCFVPLQIQPEFSERLRAALDARLPLLRPDSLRHCVTQILPRWRALGVQPQFTPAPGGELA